MKPRILSFFLALSLPSAMAVAAPRTIIFEVQNMTCSVCPLTVKKALQRVSGVQQVSVDYERKTAHMQFDDAITTADKLMQATGNAGYPSVVKGDGK